MKSFYLNRAFCRYFIYFDKNFIFFFVIIIFFDKFVSTIKHNEKRSGI